MMSLDDFTISAPPATDPRKALDVPGRHQGAAAAVRDRSGRRRRREVEPRRPCTSSRRRASRQGRRAAGVGRRRARRSAAPTSSATRRRGCSARATSPRTLEVKPLPETDKPASFAGAVGSQFSIAVAHEPLGRPARRAGRARHHDQERPAPRHARPRPASTARWPAQGQVHRARRAADRRALRRRQDEDVQGHRAGHRPGDGDPRARVLVLRSGQAARYQTIHSDPIALSRQGRQHRRRERRRRDATKPKTSAPTRRADDTRRASVRTSRCRRPARSASSRSAARCCGCSSALLYAMPLALLALRTWQLRTAASARKPPRSAPRADAPRTSSRAPRSNRPARPPARSPPRCAAYARTLDRDRSTTTAACSRASRPRASRRPPRRARCRRTSATASPISCAVVGAPARRTAVVATIRPARGTARRPCDASPALAPPRLQRSRTARPRRRPRRLPAGDDADRRVRAQGRVRARRDARSARPPAPRPITPSCSPTGATPRSPPATSRPPRSRIAARSRSTPTTRAPVTTSRGCAAASPKRSGPRTTAPTDTLFFFHDWPRSRRLLVGARRVRRRDPAARAVARPPPPRARRPRAAPGRDVDRDDRVAARRGSPPRRRRRHGRRRAARRRQRRRPGRDVAAACRAAPRSRSLERRDAWTKVRLASGHRGLGSGRAPSSQSRVTR